MYSEFSKRLKKLRTDSGISQYKLSENIGLSRTMISNYEQGLREPDFKTLILISDYFDVSVDYILGATNFKKKHAAPEKMEQYEKMLYLIDSLSEESKKDLMKYIKLLALKDSVKR